MLNMETMAKKNIIRVTACKVIMQSQAKGLSFSTANLPCVATKRKSAESVCECAKNFHFLDENEGMWVCFFTNK